MKYLPLLWSGLWRKRVRTVFTMLSIVAAFVLFGLLHGLTAAFDELIGQMSDTRLRVQSRVNVTQGLPIGYRSRIESVPGVTGIGYWSWMGGYYQDPQNPVQVGAIDPGGLPVSAPDAQIPAEYIAAMRNTRTGAIVGKDVAERYGWKIGDHVPIGTQFWTRTDGTYDWAFDVVGIYDYEGETPSNEFWINWTYFDEARARAKNRVSLYFVEIDNPARATEISQAIDALFANSTDESETQSDKDWVRAQISQLGDINFFVNAIIAAVLFTLLFVTGNTMMQSVRERIPELAVLKTYGFSNTSLLSLVFTEAALLCVAAAAIGLAIAANAFSSVYTRIGFGNVPLPWSVFTAGLALAAVVALVSAMLPALRAQRLNVVDALAER